VFDVVVPKPGASSWQTHRSKERLERAVVSLSARDLADWYGKICQPVASCFATISKQVRDSGRCHGLGGRRVYPLATLALTRGISQWNACTTYNLLSEEGRRVAAALLPLQHRQWRATHSDSP
jgi:hypothetical protein